MVEVVAACVDAKRRVYSQINIAVMELYDRCPKVNESF